MDMWVYLNDVVMWVVHGIEHEKGVSIIHPVRHYPYKWLPFIPEWTFFHEGKEFYFDTVKRDDVLRIEYKT